MAEGITQSVLARGIAKTTAFVSQLVNDDTGASQDTIDAILAFLTAYTGRRVTYSGAGGYSFAEPPLTPVSENGPGPTVLDIREPQKVQE